jgi:putative zinc finger/helix-turn-helix YgiT family protein
MIKERSNAMKGICPICEKETELEFINRVEDINIRGEKIPVPAEYFKCLECESEFEDPQSAYDPLEAAYHEYRVRHVMVQPEEIKQFRERFGLTQLELSNLLGLGGATLSRYENGALQDEAHDTMLRLAMQPENLLDLIEEKTSVFSDEKRERILTLLKEIREEHEKSFLSIYETYFGSYPANVLSGYQPLHVSKLLNAILFFCKNAGIPKTKLNKLLFYADFKHFKEYSISITGVRYAHLPHGPVPDKYNYYMATLEDEKSIFIDEREFPSYTGEFLTAIREPDLSIFSTTELKTLATVKEFFENHTAKEIRNFSHKERGYEVTRDGELISYEYAQFLQI